MKTFADTHETRGLLSSTQDHNKNNHDENDTEESSFSSSSRSATTNNNAHNYQTMTTTSEDDTPQNKIAEPEAALAEAPVVERHSLTFQERWNLTFSLLAWAFTVCNVTLVVGTSAVVVLSVGGEKSLTSMPLGTFFIGASLVSLFITPWLFQRLGRKLGFLVGIAFGLVGTVLGCLSVLLSSPPIFIVATTWFGMAMGIGFFLRFAVVEVVPKHFSAQAMTLVVSGGVLAAFAGPESAQVTRDWLGTPGEDAFLGTFVMTGIFNLANALCICLISFPMPTAVPKGPSGEEKLPTLFTTDRELWSLLKCPQFLSPMVISALAWAAMAMPMSIVRVVMGQVGFSSRQSLWVIELHFCGMYAPGFVAGNIIKAYGPRKVCLLGIGLFAVSLLFLFLADDDDETGVFGAVPMFPWLMGLLGVGAAWNLWFAASTFWTTAVYRPKPHYKPQVQAANDFGMFFLSGGFITSASYIFEAGGTGLEGWAVLNAVVAGLVVCVGVVLALEAAFEGSSCKDTTTNSSQAVETAEDIALQKIEAAEATEPTTGMVGASSVFLSSFTTEGTPSDGAATPHGIVVPTEMVPVVEESPESASRLQVDEPNNVVVLPENGQTEVVVTNVV